tara:strand:- start:366 stop:1103 length:738 start_codon:yes stop_codon:yes gene_type:complete
MITYAIPVCNESVELKLLLRQLIPYLREGDDILIQGDEGNVTDDVISVISSFLTDYDRISYTEYPLNSDFAAFKNNLLKYVKNKWIFQIDADEIVSETLLGNIHWLLTENPDINGYLLPRVNLVQGLTQEWVDRWGWNISKGVVQQGDESTVGILTKYGIDIFNGSLKLVNFPDYQNRLFRTDRGIKWVNKVHEVLTTDQPIENIRMPLPCSQDGRSASYEYCLFHVKKLDRQVKQNELYSKIIA